MSFGSGRAELKVPNTPSPRGETKPAEDERIGPPSHEILIRCPRTSMTITTGLKAEWVIFKSLPPVAVPLQCPACGQMHRWKPKDAWIGILDQAGEPPDSA